MPWRQAGTDMTGATQMGGTSEVLARSRALQVSQVVSRARARARDFIDSGPRLHRGAF